MTESELQEEAGILSLACGQLGNELAQFGAQFAQGRLSALEHVHEKFPEMADSLHKTIGTLMRRYEKLQAMTKALKEQEAAKSKPNGHAEDSIQGSVSPA